jgi:protein phosphatase 1 regulatory subunit 11
MVDLVCCIYHRPKDVGESSDESSSDSSDSSGSDSEAGPSSRKARVGGGDGKHNHDHCSGHRRGKRKPKKSGDKRAPSPNAYERVPKPKAKDSTRENGGSSSQAKS